MPSQHGTRNGSDPIHRRIHKKSIFEPCGVIRNSAETLRPTARLPLQEKHLPLQTGARLPAKKASEQHGKRSEPIALISAASFNSALQR